MAYYHIGGMFYGWEKERGHSRGASRLGVSAFEGRPNHRIYEGDGDLMGIRKDDIRDKEDLADYKAYCGSMADDDEKALPFDEWKQLDKEKHPEEDEDIKQIMAENKDILFCSKCNTPLEVVEEPMIRIRHYYCSKCKENKAGRAY